MAVIVHDGRAVDDRRRSCADRRRETAQSGDRLLRRNPARRSGDGHQRVLQIMLASDGQPQLAQLAAVVADHAAPAALLDADNRALQFIPGADDRPTHSIGDRTCQRLARPRVIPRR